MATPDLAASIVSLAISPAIGLFLTPAAILLVFCVWNHSKIRWVAVWSSFALGASIVYPVGLLQLQSLFLVQVFDAELTSAAVRAFGHTAFSEEGAKLLIIAVLCFLFARRPADAVGCGLAVGLGFAAAENLVYAVGAADWRSMGLTRMITAVPAHAVFGLIMGSLVAEAIARPSRSATYGVGALLLPSLLHGLYNFPLYMLASIDTASASVMWGYGSLFVITIFVGVTIALTTADAALRRAPIGAPARDLACPASGLVSNRYEFFGPQHPLRYHFRR